MKPCKLRVYVCDCSKQVGFASSTPNIPNLETFIWEYKIFTTNLRTALSIDNNEIIINWQIKIFARNVAIAGGYLLVAGGLVDSKKSPNLRPSLLQLGRQTQAFYAIFNGYLLWASPADRAVHISHLPLGRLVTTCLIILFILCGIMLYGGLQVPYFARLVAWLLVIVTVFVEFDTKYWKIRGMPFWEQVLVGSQNVCAIANLIILGRIREW